LGILKRFLDASDSLTKDLENVVAALQKRMIYGDMKSITNSSDNGGSASRSEGSGAADDTKK
jgi:hypothetical protein